MLEGVVANGFSTPPLEDAALKMFWEGILKEGSVKGFWTGMVATLVL
jgi:hypothetical protein